MNVSSDELDMQFEKLPDTRQSYYYHLHVVDANNPTDYRVYDCSSHMSICYTEVHKKMTAYNLSVVAIYMTPDEGPGQRPYPVSSWPSASATQWTSSEGT